MWGIIFSVLLLPARMERHCTRCKYVIRCNMMAVIIRVFYDHGMNFPLKAPTRAYYLVTRYHVNGKATRLYKARYLENFQVFIRSMHSGVCSTRPGSGTSLLLYLSLTSVIVIEYTKEGLKH